MNVRPAGRSAALLQVAHPASAAAEVREAAAAAGVTLQEVVPGAETVLVVAARAADLTRLLARLPEVTGSSPMSAGHGPEGAVCLDVRYDGPDLAAVGELTGLGAEGVVAAHSGARFRGAFGGFAPGFCYLEGLPATLRVPRLPEPRPSVPAGAVAVADRYSAVYPRSTPGGWRILGHTDTAIWDSRREPPALLRPGTLVTFRAVPVTTAP